MTTLLLALFPKLRPTATVESFASRRVGVPGMVDDTEVEEMFADRHTSAAGHR